MISKSSFKVNNSDAAQKVSSKFLYMNLTASDNVIISYSYYKHWIFSRSPEQTKKSFRAAERLRSSSSLARFGSPAYPPRQPGEMSRIGIEKSDGPWSMVVFF